VAVLRTEKEIQNDALVALQEAWPFGLFYRRNVGGMKIGDRFVKFGVKGQADIAGCVEGRMVEVEMKRPCEKQTQDQRHWQQAVERCGGIYVLATSAQEAVDGVRSKL
jgi:hypothetical protein